MTLDRRTFSKALIAGTMGGWMTGRAAAAVPPTGHARNIVLAHGLFARCYWF